MKSLKYTILFAGITALFVASCSTPANIPYMQDALNGTVDTVATDNMVRFRPGDKVSILVNSREPKVSDMFNLPRVNRVVGNVTNTYYNQGDLQGYTISSDGCIDFPVLGSIRVEGLSRDELASVIKTRLVSEGLVQEPVITVEFLNLKVSVLGEVVRPGNISIDRDRFTIMDALSEAGDLTIYGMRDRVKVIRNENGVNKTYVLNLLSSTELFDSPAYYLQQDDIIYVEPNDVRARQSTVNGNNIRSTSFWISLASLLTSMTSTIVLFIR